MIYFAVTIVSLLGHLGVRDLPSADASAAELGADDDVGTVSIIIPARDEEVRIENTVRNLLATPPDRTDTRAYAERFSWDETTRGQLALFRGIVDRRAV